MNPTIKHLIGKIEDYYKNRIPIEELIQSIDDNSDNWHQNNTVNKTNDGNSIQVFVQYASVIMERIGLNFYLSTNGETFSLKKEDVESLLYEMDSMQLTNPMTAAYYLYEQKDRFNKISK